MNKYGLLIENLITLKDSHRDELEFGEIDTINQACNALEAEGNCNEERSGNSL